MALLRRISWPARRRSSRASCDGDEYLEDLAVTSSAADMSGDVISMRLQRGTYRAVYPVTCPARGEIKVYVRGFEARLLITNMDQCVPRFDMLTDDDAASLTRSSSSSSICSMDESEVLVGLIKLPVFIDPTSVTIEYSGQDERLALNADITGGNAAACRRAGSQGRARPSGGATTPPHSPTFVYSTVEPESPPGSKDKKSRFARSGPGDLSRRLDGSLTSLPECDRGTTHGGTKHDLMSRLRGNGKKKSVD